MDSGRRSNIKDIFKATTVEKAGIGATSSTVNVDRNTTDLTNQADRQFVNGDFYCRIGVHTAIFSEKGRGKLGKPLRSFDLTVLSLGNGRYKKH